MQKISHGEFIKQITLDGYYAIIATPYKSFNTEAEQIDTLNKWLEIAKTCHRDLALKDYGKFAIQGNKLVRIVHNTNSILTLKGFKVYKYADRYILVKTSYDDYCGYYIKLIIYHKVNVLW